MRTTIESAFLRVSVESFGAEMMSVEDKRTGREYLWHGDAEWWKRRSPVLFPCVGSLWNKVTRIKGKEYSMGQHGFARDMEFERVAYSDNRLVYSLKSNKESLAHYPCCFELQIGYTLQENTLSVDYLVCNQGEEDMPFQIGAHPAFVMPEWDEDHNVLGYARLKGTAPFVVSRVGEKGCISRSVGSLDAQEIAITRQTFDSDAIVFESPAPEEVVLTDFANNPLLRLSANCPSLGIWSPGKGRYSPFVCIEPWWGRADWENYEGEFCDRDYVNILRPGESKRFCWKLEIMG